MSDSQATIVLGAFSGNQTIKIRLTNIVK